MKERKADGLSPVKYFFEAFNFEVREINRARWENDRWQMTSFEKLLLLVRTLKPSETKELICNYASYEWGRNILTQVFPKAENPDEYHSRNGVVCVSESPIQVLGWQEFDDLKDEGVGNGLKRDYIDLGFNNEAENRGIDLEWSFFEKPRNSGVGESTEKNLLGQ